MARFTMRTMPDFKGKGEGTTYPKMIIDGCVDTDHLVEVLHDRSSFSSADIKGLLAGLADYIAEQTALGHSVKIDELGVFTATLAVHPDKEREVEGGTRRNAQSIGLRSIKFRPARSLVNKARQRCELTRKQQKPQPLKKATREERLAAAHAHLAQTGMLKVTDYLQLTGLSRTTASRELRQFAEEGLLVAQGMAPHKYYTKPTEQV